MKPWIYPSPAGWGRGEAHRLYIASYWARHSIYSAEVTYTLP